jgi:SET domain-containing protein
MMANAICSRTSLPPHSMVDVAVGKSRIEGKGVFATRDFKKGETILKWDTSRIIPTEKISEIQENERKYIIPFREGMILLIQPPERYVNHSCDPNSYSKDCCVIAKRDIRNGEEITGDYERGDGTYFDFSCDCGSKKCKGFVLGKFKKKPK